MIQSLKTGTFLVCLFFFLFPANSNQPPQLTILNNQAIGPKLSIALDPPSHVSLSFKSVLGQKYYLMISDTVSPGTRWTSNFEPIFGTGETLTVPSLFYTVDNRFYRLLLVD